MVSYSNPTNRDINLNNRIAVIYIYTIKYTINERCLITMEFSNVYYTTYLVSHRNVNGAINLVGCEYRKVVD